MKKINAKIYVICVTLLLSLTIVSTITSAMHIPGMETITIDSLHDQQYPNQLLQHRRMIPSYQPSASTEQGMIREPQYITTDLAEATDPLGVAQCEAVGINNNGEIVGYEVLDEFKYRSIYWSQNGIASILENNEGDNSSRPYMIDDNGLILGWSAFVWYEWIGDFKKLHMNQTAVTWKDQVCANLNDEVTGGDTLDLYHARDKNNAGQIVGSGAPPGNEPPPWWPNGFILDQGIVTDLGDATHPEAINNQGHIAGYIEGGFTHAYEWEDGNLVDLNNPPILANYSQAFDINNNDIIVGFAQMSYSGYEEPIVWINHEPVRVLTNNSSRFFGYATAINKKDEVVGWYIDYNSPNPLFLAFLWKDGKTIILNDFLPSDQGWEDIYPEDINDHGQIVGLGYRDGYGWRAFLMTPPTPVLNIEVKGGFGITASINNTGYAPATNVSWSISLDGGLIFLGKETIGSIANIAAGDISQIRSKLILGIGKTTITIHAECDEAVEVTKSVNGSVFLVFTLGVH